MIIFLPAKKLQLQLRKPEGWSTENNRQNPMRVLLEKLTGFQPVKKFPHFRESKLSLSHSQMPTKCPYPSQLNPIHTPTSHLLKIHIDIMFPYMPGPPKWSLSLRFPHQNPVHASPISHTHYMHCPSHSSRFYQLNNIGLGVKIIKFHIA